jgi:hypothetical protein
MRFDFRFANLIQLERLSRQPIETMYVNLVTKAHNCHARGLGGVFDQVRLIHPQSGRGHPDQLCVKTLGKLRRILDITEHVPATQINISFRDTTTAIGANASRISRL